MATPTPGTMVEVWVEPPPRPLPPARADAEAPRRVPNAQRRFWIADAAGDERRRIAARLRAQTPHAVMWVEEGIWHDVRRLEQAAQHFESDVYPVLRAAFGSEWTPGIDGDPHINIVHVTDLGENILGYTSSLDEYPSDLHPMSNEAEMITINVETVEIASPSYGALLARELLQLIQWHQDRNEERWVREGLAELAAAMMGANTDRLRQAYLQRPDTPLSGWTGAESQRGATYLFASYLHGRFGDAGTRALTASPANGVTGVEAALAKLDAGMRFEDLFADWLVANYLDGEQGIEDGPYSYLALDLPQPTPAAIHDSYPVTVETSVNQLGADYVLLRGEGNLTVRFAGQEQTPLWIDAPDVDGQVWWSNRADESLTTLTQRFDLSSVEEATLSYRAWYDIEPHYDYATVAISSDGGESWLNLPAPSGTNADPHGNNPGWGYTGQSAGWIDEEIDVSDHTGGEVLVRFSYLTDAAVTGEGLLLDDIAISRANALVGQEVRAEQTDRWDAEGFVLTDGLVSQDYLALLIHQGEGIAVERLSFDEERSAEWIVPLDSGGPREAVLILSAMAPLTRQPAPYRLVITP